MSDFRVRFSDLKIAKVLKHYSVLFSGVNFFLQRAGLLVPEGQHLRQLDVVGMTKRQLQVDNIPSHSSSPLGAVDPSPTVRRAS